jgi:hypothetical protein
MLLLLLLLEEAVQQQHCLQCLLHCLWLDHYWHLLLLLLLGLCV